MHNLNHTYEKGTHRKEENATMDEKAHGKDFRQVEASEHYMAYFTILGCRCFLSQNPEKSKDLLLDMHAAFDAVSNIVACVQKSAMKTSECNKGAEPELKAYKKAFSNHVLLCFEKTGDAFFDLNNLLAMVSIVADIQREFMLKYGLSLRGCISCGSFSMDEDCAFGRGLVETTSMDELSRMPRIVFTHRILSELDGIKTSTREQELSWFYDAWMNELLFADKDGSTVLNYLYDIDYSVLERTPFFSKVSSIIEGRQPKSKSSGNTGNIHGKGCLMKEHAAVIEGKLNEYGGYPNAGEHSDDAAGRRSEVFQKYLWTAKFHNAVCAMKGLGDEYGIDVESWGIKGTHGGERTMRA